MGNGIELYAETSEGCILSSCLLGRKGLSAEQLGKDVATKLLENLENEQCVDEYMQDQVVNNQPPCVTCAHIFLSPLILDNICSDCFLFQVIILMALAKGHSCIRTGKPTLHTQTAIVMAEKMTGVTFSHTQVEDGSFLLQADGIGFMNSYM